MKELDELDKQKSLYQLMTKLNEAETSICEKRTISADELEAELGVSDWNKLNIHKYVSHNYIFYRVEKDAVIIVEMFDEREDFMHKLFGDWYPHEKKTHEGLFFMRMTGLEPARGLPTRT